MIDVFPFIFFSIIKIICADYRKKSDLYKHKEEKHNEFVVLLAQRKPA